MELPAETKWPARELAWEVLNETGACTCDLCCLQAANVIESRLLAERLSATERAAKIAENHDAWPQEGADIAAAIRSQP